MRLAALGMLVLLAVSAVSLFLAPLMMPEDYSWIRHGTSESAAQHVEGAWLARLGFLTFGFAVMWQALSLRRIWGRGAVWCHLGFGVCMAAAAAFSVRSWDERLPYDAVEDFLHSLVATVAGFAFAFGVLVVLWKRRKSQRFVRALDSLAILAATVLPIGMSLWPDRYGLMQRLLFAISYLWYAREVWRVFLLGTPRRFLFWLR